MAAGYVEHAGIPGSRSSGRDGLKQLIALYHGAFPDLRSIIEDVFVEGDRVAYRWTARHPPGRVGRRSPDRNPHDGDRHHRLPRCRGQDSGGLGQRGHEALGGGTALADRGWSGRRGHSGGRRCPFRLLLFGLRCPSKEPDVADPGGESQGAGTRRAGAARRPRDPTSPPARGDTQARRLATIILWRLSLPWCSTSQGSLTATTAP